MICCVAGAGSLRSGVGVVRAKPNLGDRTMRHVTAGAVLLFASMSAYALAPKACEELKAEVGRKLDAQL